MNTESDYTIAGSCDRGISFPTLACLTGACLLFREYLSSRCNGGAVTVASSVCRDHVLCLENIYPLKRPCFMLWKDVRSPSRGLASPTNPNRHRVLPREQKDHHIFICP